MFIRLLRTLIQVARRQQGSVAVEFAIIVPVLFLLVFGAIDFGHAWYMRHVLQNGCREGARYGSRYQTNGSGDRLLPKDLVPSISNYILNNPADNGGSGCGLSSLLPCDANPAVTPSGPAATESDVKQLALKDLTVTVTARKSWFIIDKLVPGMTKNYVDISVSTTVKCE
jgi:Flp pilus assembly protein TadG